MWGGLHDAGHLVVVLVVDEHFLSELGLLDLVVQVVACDRGERFVREAPVVVDVEVREEDRVVAE